MFVGAINSEVRQFLGNVANVFDGQQVVVGCSGNFTLESVISQCSAPAAIHSNDVSFYSCMMGRWLTKQSLEYKITDPDFAWLDDHLGTEDGTHRLAAIMVLLDALEFRKRNNSHRVRMWNLYQESFADLVEKTAERLDKATVKIDSYFAGDVMTHFERFGDRDDAIFCCYAPTYAGGYERLYRELDKIVVWDRPQYEPLNDKRRDALLAWMADRRYLWYDDRVIEGLRPVMEQRSGTRNTVYLYSNVIGQTAVFRDMANNALPDLPLAGVGTKITPNSQVWLERITTTELACYKNAYLNKHILFASGKWAFAVMVDGLAVGFLEFGTDGNSAMQMGDRTAMYMMADFPVPHTAYRRLSKLMVMLAVSGQTRQALERLREYRLTSLHTTAFTDKPVSMKYRGVLEVAKRGEKDGQKFLNYEGKFNGKTWRETLQEWLTKHGSQTS